MATDFSQADLAKRQDILRDLGFTEQEIGSVSTEGLHHVHQELLRMAKTERCRRYRGSKLVARQNMIDAALEIERNTRRMDRATRYDTYPALPRMTDPKRKAVDARGARIAECRIAKRHTIDWLAHALACSHARVRMIEAGEVEPSATEMRRISLALGISVEIA